jgi:sulfite dehydrogenase (quinone) subunit SoeC
MNPAWSVILLTTLSGLGQGLAVALAVLAIGHGDANHAFVRSGVGLALLLCAGGLAASFFHLGRPERAWRAAAMWRTSWLSREVIALPAFMASLALWWLWPAPLPALIALVLAFVLWGCTAMIYACLRFVREWAHPLTLAGFTAIGLASGTLLAAALAALAHQADLALGLARWALLLIFIAWAIRCAAFLRNASLKPKSTLQSATGIRAERVVQISMGFTGGAFNTREFFHGASRAALAKLHWAVHGLAFGLPVVLAAWATQSGPLWALPAACTIQCVGLLAERWLFFAQARHPQNLYYQVVS